VKFSEDGGSVDDVESGGYKSEFIAANQALRTSTWLNTFYLITTDILGKKGYSFEVQYPQFSFVI
jgi:hypothetical protein